MLMPVLIYQYGPKQAVPIMAVAAVMANLSRILAWYREVDWRACVAYSVPAIPAAALGARTLLVLPSHVVDVSIGLFFGYDGASTPLAHQPSPEIVALAACNRRSRDWLPHRHRRLDRPLERAAIPVLRPRQEGLPRHGGGEFARHVCEQVRDLPPLWRADAGSHAGRPGCRLVADVRRRQAFCDAP